MLIVVDYHQKEQYNKKHKCFHFFWMSVIRLRNVGQGGCCIVIDALLLFNSTFIELMEQVLIKL